MSVNKSTSKIYYILLCAFILRILFFFLAQPWTEDFEKNRIFTGDAYAYNVLSMNLYNHQEFNDENNQPDTIRTPGFPAFVSFIYFIFGVKPYLILFLQIIINTITVFIVYKIANLYFSENISLLSAILYTLEPINIVWNLYLLTDIIFTFVLALLYLLLFYSIKLKKINYLILSFIICGIAVYIRPIALYLPVIMIIIIMVSRTFSVKKTMKLSIFGLLAFILVLSPWYVRNYILFKEIGFTTIQGFGYLVYSLPKYESLRTGKSEDITKSEILEMAIQKGWKESNNPFENNSICVNLYYDYLKQNWKTYLPTYLKMTAQTMLQGTTKTLFSKLNMPVSEKNIDLTQGSDYFQNIKESVLSKSYLENISDLYNIIFNFVVYISFLIGLIKLYKKKKFFIVSSFLIIISYFILTPAVTDGRYKLPVTVLYLIIASYGLSIFFKKKNSIN